MDKDKAKSILKHIKGMDGSFGELSKLLRDISDEAERKIYLKRLGDVFGIIYTEIMFPIVREFPDLDPDKARSKTPKKNKAGLRPRKTNS